MSLILPIPRLAEAAPPADDIYDIVVLAPKDPFWPLIVWSLLGLLVVGALIWMVWYLLAGSKGPRGKQSPEFRALRRLALTEREQESLSSNQFALSLSDTLKDYLAEKFDDPLRYETTPEFLHRISNVESKLPAAAQQQLRTFLVEAEEIKFGNASDAAQKAAPLSKSAAQVIQLCQLVNDGEKA